MLEVRREKLLEELHRVIAKCFERGDYGVLLSGVDAQVVASRIGLSVDEVCRLALEEAKSGNVVVVSRDGDSCRLLPREADVVRSVLLSVPLIDFKVYVEERKALRVVEDCFDPNHVCEPAFLKLVHGLGLSSEEVRILHSVYHGVGEGFRGSPSAFTTTYVFQLDAWIKILESLVRGRSACISILAGTGEGKTEAFLLPLLLHLVLARVRGKKAKVLIVYPRKALATDQLNRITKIVYHVNRVLEAHGLRKIHVAILDGDTPRSWRSDAVVDTGLREACNLCEKGELSLHQVYRGITCPSCGEALLKIDSCTWCGLVERDVKLGRRLLEPELGELLSGVSQDIWKKVIRTARIEASKPILTCPRCGATIDFVYMTKTDIANPDIDEPDLVIASMEAIAARLGDPSIANRALKGLTAVVVDEAHVLNGFQGVHYAMIIRRLLLINKLEGYNPLVIVSSATIGNPQDLCKLLQLEHQSYIEVNANNNVYRSAKPAGFNYYVFIVPSETIKAETALTSIAFTLLHTRRQVLVFANTRRAAEDIAKFVYERGDSTITQLDPDECQGEEFCLIPVLADSGILNAKLQKLREKGFDWKYTVITVDPDTYKALASRKGSKLKLDPETIKFHHAGLTREERAQIESEFKKGKVKLVAATSTLELGINIGDLDTIVLFGFPREAAAFFQRAGRAGRRRGINPIIVTLVSQGHRDIHYYLHIDAMLRDPRRYFRVEVPVSTAVDILAAHCFAAVLDYITHNYGVGTAPASIPTVQTAAKLSTDVIPVRIDGLLSKLLGGFFDKRDVSVSQTLKEVELQVLTGLELLYKFVKVVEECGKGKIVNPVRASLALNAALYWEAVDDQRALEWLDQYVSEAINAVSEYLINLLEKLDIALTESDKSSIKANPHTLLEVIDRNLEYRKDRAKILAKNLADNLLELLSATVLLDALNALSSKISSIRNIYSYRQKEDIPLVTLYELLRHARALHTLYSSILRKHLTQDER